MMIIIILQMVLAMPTEEPTAMPTEELTVAPTSVPSAVPTVAPASVPAAVQTAHLQPSNLYLETSPHCR
jgi:hypothetical protein